MSTAGTAFTHKNLLTEVEDLAPGMGVRGQEIRMAASDLDAEKTGVAHHRLEARHRQGFGHRHDNAEEIYLVLSGSGRAKLDDDIVELGPLDAIRIAPPVTRSFEAGPDGLELFVCGARHEGDGELIQDWWQD